ncbi:MAG: AbrB/MazE/SpoVT family DNA-binding domain-containing protein [Chloroflexi bacterium]|nr:MAG: AbrB/MazE/SpoVT family DNA-binding domain-containing protein [Chloroflexota bacterium]
MSKSRRVTADATLTSKGQLTLPAPIREAINVRTGDKLRFETAGAGKLVVTPLRRPDVLSLAGVFGEASKRVGHMDITELRKRAWNRRGQRLRERK